MVQLGRLTVFQNLVKMLQVVHDDITMFLENGQRNEQMEAAGEIICPECLPETKDISPFKLALVPDQQHAEEEKEVGAISGLQMQIELGK